jgi:transcriptional regulator with PAS, ATPase and Fis domain
VPPDASLTKIIQSLRRTTATGSEFIKEVTSDLELLVRGERAARLGVAVFLRSPGGHPQLKSAENLNLSEIAAAEQKLLQAFAAPADPPAVEPGDNSIYLILGGADQSEAVAIYARGEQPFTEAQARDLNIFSEVARLAHDRTLMLNGAPQKLESEGDTAPPPAVMLPGMVYVSRAMNDVARAVERIKDSESTVLITGESGTGKELIAQAIHSLSTRFKGPFIPFNCTAAPADLVESLLFGHRKGAFTGAFNDNPGLIRAAEGGMLFLDEIGDLPLNLQPKLLRFLQEGEVHTLGERAPRRIHLRVICATHKDLEQAVREGTFRQDLYYRIAGLTIHVKPLRERPEDISVLISHFLAYYARRNNRPALGISPEAVRALQRYTWPGNIRELAAEIERLVLYTDEGRSIGLRDLSERICPENARPRVEAEDQTGPISLDNMLDDYERQIITDALRRHDYNVANTATALGLGSRQTLYKKLKRLAINIGEFLKDEDQPGLQLRSDRKNRSEPAAARSSSSLASTRH